MDDEVIVAAKIFAEHCFTCQICANPGPVCCAEGESMLEDFYDALNASLMKRNPQKDVN